MNSFAGKIAIITGGGDGMGRALAVKLASEGCHVAMCDVNTDNLDASQAAALAVAPDGTRVTTHVCDVSDEAQLVAFRDAMLEAHDTDHVHLVFNNAGIGGAIGPILELDVDHWDHTFAVMARGVFLGIKHGGRAMRKSGRGGSIINTASIAALSGCGGPLAYSATKASVVNITMNAAVELAYLNIRVNAVCPGVIFTDLMHRGHDVEAEQTVEKIQPLPFRGEPEHIASMVRFLASDESSFVTGTTQVVDGGYLANGLLGVHPLPGVSKRPNYTGMNYGTTGRGTEISFLESTDDA